MSNVRRRRRSRDRQSKRNRRLIRKRRRKLQLKLRKSVLISMTFRIRVDRLNLLKGRRMERNRKNQNVFLRFNSLQKLQKLKKRVKGKQRKRLLVHLKTRVLIIRLVEVNVLRKKMICLRIIHSLMNKGM